MKKRDSWDEMFARGLKETRERLGKSQQWIADQMVTVGHEWLQTTVYKAENNNRKVSIGEAAALADLLNVDLEDLLAEETNSEKQFDRRLWNIADDCIGSLLKVDEAALEAAREQDLLRNAVRDFDAHGYLTVLKFQGPKLTAAQAYAPLLETNLPREVLGRLRNELWSRDGNPEFVDLASDHQGYVELRKVPEAGRG